jgi:hypothetical protein
MEVMGRLDKETRTKIYGEIALVISFSVLTVKRVSRLERLHKDLKNA